MFACTLAITNRGWAGIALGEPRPDLFDAESAARDTAGQRRRRGVCVRGHDRARRPRRRHRARRSADRRGGGRPSAHRHGASRRRVVTYQPFVESVLQLRGRPGLRGRACTRPGDDGARGDRVRARRSPASRTTTCRAPRPSALRARSRHDVFMTGARQPSIRTPDQRIRVFVSSTLRELATERAAVRAAIERMRLAPVMFELGARPHPPRELYRSYLAQSDVFVGIYADSYGWVAPDEEISGLEDEYNLAPREMPKLIYIKRSEHREERLKELIGRIQRDDTAAYLPFETADDLEERVANDLATLLAERFDQARHGEGAPADREGAASLVSRVPAPYTTTIGRERDLAHVRQLLAEGQDRVVSLIGPGGIGKSRLAIEVAHATEDLFPDGTYFVLLEGVLEPGLLLPTIAYTLGIRDNGEAGLEERIARALEGRRVLIVLDNFEQIVDAAPLLVRLYTVAPLASFLVTSRVVLRIRGEQVYEVAAARRARGHRAHEPRAGAPVAGGAAVRRSRSGGQARVHPHRRERRRRRRHLPATRRTAAGDRARRGEGAPAHPAGDRAAPRARAADADGIRARSARPPPHDAGDDRLEREPAPRRSAGAPGRPRRLRHAVHAGCRRGDRRGAVVGRAGARRPVGARRRLARPAGRDRRPLDVHAAGDHARVRDRAAEGARRGRRHARGPRRLLPRRSCGRRHRVCAGPDRPTRSRSWGWSCPTCGPPRAISSTPTGSTMPATSPGPCSSTGGSRASSARCGCGCSSCSRRISRSRRTRARRRCSSRCGPSCGSARPKRSCSGLGESVRLFTESGDRDAAAMALAARASARLQFADLDPATAQAELDEAVATLHELGDEWGESMAETGTGLLSLVNGDDPRGRRALRPCRRGRRRGARHVHAGRLGQQPRAA